MKSLSDARERRAVLELLIHARDDLELTQEEGGGGDDGGDDSGGEGG